MYRTREKLLRNALVLMLSPIILLKITTTVGGNPAFPTFFHPRIHVHVNQNGLCSTTTPIKGLSPIANVSLCFVNMTSRHPFPANRRAVELLLKLILPAKLLLAAQFRPGEVVSGRSRVPRSFPSACRSGSASRSGGHNPREPLFAVLPQSASPTVATSRGSRTAD